MERHKNTILKKSKVKGMTLLDVKTIIATVIQTVQVGREMTNRSVQME